MKNALKLVTLRTTVRFSNRPEGKRNSSSGTRFFVERFDFKRWIPALFVSRINYLGWLLNQTSARTCSINLKPPYCLRRSVGDISARDTLNYNEKESAVTQERASVARERSTGRVEEKAHWNPDSASAACVSLVVQRTRETFTRRSRTVSARDTHRYCPLRSDLVDGLLSSGQILSSIVIIIFVARARALSAAAQRASHRTTVDFLRTGWRNTLVVIRNGLSTERASVSCAFRTRVAGGAEIQTIAAVGIGQHGSLMLFCVYTYGGFRSVRTRRSRVVLSQ